MFNVIIEYMLKITKQTNDLHDRAPSNSDLIVEIFYFN